MLLLKKVENFCVNTVLNHLNVSNLELYHDTNQGHCQWGVRGVPWRAANRLHGQRTGAFSWSPVLRPFQEDQPIPARPYPELRTWKVAWSGVFSVSPHTREMPQHLTTCGQPPWFCHACIPPTTSIHAPTKPTIAMTNYTHASSVSSSPSTRSASASEIIHRNMW